MRNIEPQLGIEFVSDAKGFKSKRMKKLIRLRPSSRKFWKKVSSSLSKLLLWLKAKRI